MNEVKVEEQQVGSVLRLTDAVRIEDLAGEGAAAHARLTSAEAGYQFNPACLTVPGSW